MFAKGCQRPTEWLPLGCQGRWRLADARSQPYVSCFRETSDATVTPALDHASAGSHRSAGATSTACAQRNACSNTLRWSSTIRSRRGSG
jgi:hypothetical protein